MIDVSSPVPQETDNHTAAVVRAIDGRPVRKVIVRAPKLVNVVV